MSRLVVVTGGAQGLGRAISMAFASQGHNVVAADISEPHGKSLEQEAAAADMNLTFVRADFRLPEACADVADAARRWAHSNAVPDSARHIGVLVNNVGIQVDNGQPVHLLDEATWDAVMNVNIKSYFLMAKHVIPGMLEQNKGGAIINIGSVQGRQSQVGIPAYAASKGAVASLTRQMAMDYSAHGIRTNTISPGTIRTPLVESLVEQDGHTCEELGGRYPLGRMGEPDDIAQLCVFLASEQAKNITGADVACDGGIMAMGSWDTRVGLGYVADNE